MASEDLPRMTGDTTRRRWIAGLAALAAIGAGPVLTGCSGPPTRPDDAPPPRPPGPAVLQHWRTIGSGQLALPGGAFGVPTLPGLPGLPGLPAPMGGAPIRLVGPVALALRAGELVVADAGLGRLIRIPQASAVASAPAWTVLPPIAGLAISPRTVLALGSDASLWALDGPSRELLQLTPGGQLIRRVSLADLTSPVGFALAGVANRVVVADDASGRWAEWRGATLAEPLGTTGEGGADAIAASLDRVYLLDRRQARIRVFALGDGRPLGLIGAGELRQPVALAADVRGRVAVLDGQDGSVVFFVPGQPALRLLPADLRVMQPAALALDDGWLAVADRVGGVVQLFRVREGRVGEGLTQ
ncbi:hypothetical protein [Sphaerotilus mobilis]|uniref:NHL repeat-containing protein n=1 Tax=Sphaerotilus mobilis TaxID=47994 RepID=A0A4Q7LVX6_9BURK|nr:hypothetical protein [Sphaerotilus mobilis]RZS58148.1 hypothetical protein EV685_0427 [Sphaerotilus mobilis]